MHYDTAKLTELCKPFLRAAYPEFDSMSDEILAALIKHIQPELVTLKESVDALAFVIERPNIDSTLLESYNHAQHKEFLRNGFAKLEPLLGDSAQAAHTLQTLCKEQEVPIKDIFSLVRICLTGKPTGPNLKDLLAMLSIDEIKARFAILL